jgi:glycosyltransferase involved in cell wall biosynthesis
MVSEFSLIIPAQDEEENLEPLMKEVDSMLQENQLQCEILLINDGSRDRTLDVMRELQRKYARYRVRVLSLDHNYGLSAAMGAGFETATCDVIGCFPGSMNMML